MEWLHDNFMAPLVAALAGWFWYDKRQRDARLTSLEIRVGEQEKVTLGQGKDDTLLAERIDNLQTLVETKMDFIQDSLARIEKG
tara:strand:+ start:246 stop:497 length:252 start_codon:yes stop_codon:yes gene_type:complete